MNGIATLLVEPHKSQVEALWRTLEERCGLIGVRLTPLPHFSYQVVEAYDQACLADVLQDLARASVPFTVRTSGLGIFSGASPILYLALVKDEPLMRFHRLLWEHTLPLATTPSPYYRPELWVPHITLAYGDVDRARLACALETLAFEGYTWEITVQNVVFIGQADKAIFEPCCIYPLGG